MKHESFRGDEVASIATEAQGIDDWNSVRWFANGNEINSHDLEMIVYIEDELILSDCADECEADLAEREANEELDQMEEKYEEIDDKCREYMIGKLADNDVVKIQQDMLHEDSSYLDCVLRGSGFKPYGQYTNAELVAEHKEQFGETNGLF